MLRANRLKGDERSCVCFEIPSCEAPGGHFCVFSNRLQSWLTPLLAVETAHAILQLHLNKLSTNSDYSQLTRILNANNDLEIFGLNDRSKPIYAYTAIQSSNGYPLF